MYSFEALQVLAFLIPGFLASATLDMLMTRRERTQLGHVIEALIFSLLVYAILALVGLGIPVHLTVTQAQESAGASQTRIVYDAVGLLVLVGLSILFPAVVASAANHDVPMRLARRLGATQRTGRATVWQDVFCGCSGYVVVHLEDGRRICGWPKYYSEKPEERCVYLEDARWIEEGRYQPIEAQGIMLDSHSGIVFIEVLEPRLIDPEEVTNAEAPSNQSATAHHEGPQRNQEGGDQA